MLLWLIILGGLPVIGTFFLVRGKAKSLARLQKQVEGDVRVRLGAIAEGVGGRIVDGPALEVPRGRMSLVASGAPASMVVDLARFTGKTPLPGVMTIVRVEDAKKVMATKNLRVLAGHAAAARYHVLVSDEDQGRRWMSAALAGALESLETAVRARCRVQMVNGVVTILAFRGMAKPEDLKAFCGGAVAVLEALDAPV